MSYLRYWGKAGGPGEEGAYHPLAYHSLDVASCGQVLLSRDALLRRRLAVSVARAGAVIEEADLVRVVTLLLATHDLGKFSGRFQRLRPDLAASLGLNLRPYPYQHRHDAMGAAFWIDHVLEHLRQRGMLVLSTGEGRLDEADCRDVLAPWVNAVTGHHGLPPGPLGGDGEIDEHMHAEQRDDAKAFVDAMTELFGTIELHFPGIPSNLGGALASSSWLLAGIAVAADWVGSNRQWFPYESPALGLREYWNEVALPRAARAIEYTKLLPRPVRVFPGFAELFEEIPTPSPLQTTAAGLDLDSEAQLILVEDQTGSGKTEAALTLASRLMERGLADGIFFALPTMATANAMHSRVASVYPRLFNAGADEVSYVLAHGESRGVLGMEHARRDRDYRPGELEIATDLRDWIGDSNKKALLAQIGVGTIDQALLAALRNKHSVLRLLGLHRHVLLVDEVHACDAYVAKTLETLLEFQAALGGSAILLSATLPIAMRRRFVAAFRRGLGSASGAAVADTPDYPLVTSVSSGGVRLVPCPARPDLARRVPVRFVHDEQAVASSIVDQVDRGRCVVWIRNTVRDALASYDSLRDELGDDRVDLFHARFLLGDRLRIERDVMRRFGKSSTAADRAGRVLVATQVVEQSLDIDFDAMVTDLAPVDLIVQRLGRLHRHPRSGRGTPELVVLAPKWSESPGEAWVRATLPGTTYVYPDPGVLWRTHRVLYQRTAIDLPSDARALIEAVYAEDSETPPGLARGAVRAENARDADRSTALFFSYHPARGYVYDGLSAAEDLGAPTRLGEATIRLRFARPSEGRLVPLLGDERTSWSLSTCRLPARQIAEAVHGSFAEDVTNVTEKMPDRGRGCLVFVVPSGAAPTWTAEGRDSNGISVSVNYDAHRGLELRRARSAGGRGAS